MKNKTFTTLFLLIPLVSNLVLSQASAHSHDRITKKLIGEQSERRHQSDRDFNSHASRHHNHSLMLEKAMLDAIIPDFQVNENAGTNGADQKSPVICTDSDGNFVMAWRDERNGDPDIYAQRYSSDGTPLGTNLKINDDFGSALQWRPSISSDGPGNFIIVWEDERNGWARDIYAQRYSSDGNPLGVNFKVNDDQENDSQYSPSVSSDSDGNFVITWADGRNQGTHIYAQRYSNDGSVMGANFKVSDEPDFAWQGFSSISTYGSGNFVITWEDARNGIYAQRYSSDGAALGNNFKVSDDPEDEGQMSPSIAMENSGNFVIAWEDERSGWDYDIYAQRYSSDGTALGSNFKVHENLGETDQEAPAVCSDGSGNFVITWADGRNEWDSDIYAQRYSSDGSVLGANFKVNDDMFSSSQDDASICTDGSGNFVVIWVDGRTDEGDIYAQRYSSDGTPLGTNIKVNDDEGTAEQKRPAVSIENSGNFVITWVDERNAWRDIYAQRYSSDGTALGINFKVNDNQEIAWAASPSISTDGSGNFLIVWYDDRSNWQDDIYAQLYSNDGAAIGSNFIINDDEADVGQYFPDVCFEGSGSFVVTWVDERIGWDRNIFAQRISSDGSTLGGNFQVNDFDGYVEWEYPSISADSSGNFVITWVDTRNNWEPDIYAQRYSSDGDTLGGNFKVNDDQEETTREVPSVSTDASGNFIITWEDWRFGDSDIFAQRYLSDGSVLDSNFVITNLNHKSPASPDVYLWNNRIFCAWTDYRAGGTGADIWANVLEWESPTSISSKEQAQIPVAFILNQNYPNPFNGTTRISYSIPTSGFVTLKIYDMLGKELQSLVNEFQNAGYYHVDFETNELTSGMYFYNLQIGRDFLETKKMMYLR